LSQPIRHVGFIKDVYKTIGYLAPFDVNEREIILEKLNECKEEELGNFIAKKLAKRIVLHRDKCGIFTCIEQVLDVEKVEVKLLERMCNDLLKVKQLLSSDAGDIKKLLEYYKRSIIPKLIKDTKTANLVTTNSTILGLSVSLRHVSFAAVGDGRLLDWGQLPLIDNVASTRNYEHPALYSLCTAIVNELPPADYCVQEEMFPVLSGDPYFKMKVNMVKLRSYMTCGLESSDKHGKGGVFCIKQGLLNKMFNLRVGNERVSMKEVLPALTAFKANEDHPFHVHISDKNWEFFKSMGDAAEPVAGALLQAMALRYVSDIIEKNYQEKMMKKNKENQLKKKNKENQQEERS